MRRSTPIAAALLGLLLPAALSAAPAHGASPWWQLLTGSRPTNLQVSPDQSEVQEVRTEKGKEGAQEFLAAKVEVGGEAIGCLGTGESGGLSADVLCAIVSGFPAAETAVEFQEILEEDPVYGPGVKVEGGPAGGEPFIVKTPGRWATQPVQVTPGNFGGPLGSASSKVVSEGSGRLVVTLTNLGDAAADAGGDAVQIHDTLPPGAQAYDVVAFAGADNENESLHCELPSTEEVDCTFEGDLPPYEAIEVEVLVALQDGAGVKAGEVSVSGGGAPAVGRAQTLTVSDAPVAFGLEYFSMRAEVEGGAAFSGEGGEEATSAGAHPFQLTNTIVANSGPQNSSKRKSGGSLHVEQPALPRNLRFTLPAGFVPNLTAVEACDMATFLRQTPFLTDECPDGSAIGVSSATVVENSGVGLARIAVPVFNLAPGRGEPARFGLMIAGDPVVIDTSVDPSDEYRGIAEVRNITQVVQFLATTTSLWGDPGSPAHDASRGWSCVYHRTPTPPGECKAPSSSERHQVPFFRLPVSCASQLFYEAAFEPWNAPLGSEEVRAADERPPLRACNQLPFDPRLSLTPTSKVAAAASGLDAEVSMPNAGLLNPKGGAISETQFKRAEVILPEGVTVNPSAAEGLAVCSEADYGRERYDSEPGVGCPEASKLGSVKIRTPLLAEEAEGALYQAKPYENPTGSLLGLYLVARIPDRGVLIKQAGKVEPDPRTGQLRTVFDGVPQVPIDYFRLHFREGGRAPLVTPPGCGDFHTIARFVPWSAQDPSNPDPDEIVERTAPFTIQRGVNGGECPTGPAPFHPGFEAGTLNNQAGSYSPFAMRLTRQDGEQDMGKFSFVLPPGVVPKLAGIPYCSDQAIAQAQSRQGPRGGHEELDAPSCPATSQIGRSIAGAGAGDQLTYVPGKLYFAGPYHGDPISAVSITPAVAGPFDAGVVVVREALRLNPITHVGEVDGSASDPIPHILKGIPLNLRDLRVYADQPEFTLNPTSCEPFAASSTIWGDGTALEPLGEHSIQLSSRFQAAGCAALGFKPKLHLKLKGGTKRGQFPALRAVYTPRKHGDANLSHLTLTFPDSEFIEQGHFRTICTRVQFAAGPGFGAECPKGSIYGHVKVSTPLLDEPLSGPAYLRSSNHSLPDLVFALHGLVDIEVSVRIDSAHGRLRANVGDAPDAPVSQAIVNMQGGQKGLFVNSRNLCLKSKRNRARVNAAGQNGKRELAKPPMRAPACGAGHRNRRHERGGGR